MLQLLHRSHDLVAIEKPAGMLVHPTGLAARDNQPTALELARDQLGAWVYPIHRLDRATSGVLLFALSSEAAQAYGQLFREKQLHKRYYAFVRGVIAEQVVVDRPMRKDYQREGSPYVEALTEFTRLRSVELPFAVGPYATSRYSLVDVRAHTGRLHQIRRHLVSISHHLIGDTVHGDGAHNRFFRAQFGINRLLLHAYKVEFNDLNTGAKISILSSQIDDFMEILSPVWSAASPAQISNSPLSNDSRPKQLD